MYPVLKQRFAVRYVLGGLVFLLGGLAIGLNSLEFDRNSSFDVGLLASGIFCTINGVVAVLITRAVELNQRSSPWNRRGFLLGFCSYFFLTQGLPLIVTVFTVSGYIPHSRSISLASVGLGFALIMGWFMSSWLNALPPAS
jgi:hypothetical protein